MKKETVLVLAELAWELWEKYQDSKKRNQNNGRNRKRR